MLQIIYGVPGSGKSYYAVWNIKKTIEKNNNVVIISNIENLKLSHLNLDELINNYGGLDKFFNVDCEFWKMDIEKKKILFIDECQRYFHKKFFSNSVFFWFQYHRHLNVDIYLITQSYRVLPTELVVLSELVIQAIPSSFRFFNNSFRYLVKDLETFETVDKIDIPFKKEVADLYTSAVIIQNNKKFTYTQKYIIGSVFLFVLSLVALLVVFPKVLFSLASQKEKEKEKEKKVVKSQSNQPNQISQLSQLNQLNQLNKLNDAFEYPNGVVSKHYRQRQISYGEFLSEYRNGVIYDLSVNYVIVYDKYNRPKTVYLIKEDKENSKQEDKQTEAENITNL
jgi:hypothetical protein